ncbi:MAG: carboxypeptidase-like regulatory domain-containing protein [Acidobacteriota bacterium]
MKLRLIALFLPLTALLAPSAVSVFGQTDREPRSSPSKKRTVVARGQLTGARGFHQVVLLKTGSGRDSTAQLAVETTGPKPRTIWLDRFPATDINNVQVSDLDGDGVPEIIALFRRGTSPGAILRLFHWDRSSQAFVEINARDERGTPGIRSYRLGGPAGHRRIVVYAGARNVPDSEFELRGSELIRVGGGAPVTPQGESGVEGQAVISPAHPGPTRQGDSSSAPYQTTLVVLSTGDGREMARVQTGSDGRFRISLPPGEYTIGLPPDQQRRKFPRGEEQTVKVLPGKFTNVTINFDSGMR